MKSFFINRVLLFPYFLILTIRHYFYNKAFLKSYTFSIPIISIGNLSVGGTGKTPHTEYFLKNALKYGSIAVLSRGYGRKTRGFRFININDNASEAGDEPLQIKRKYPEAIVVVDGNRVRAIKRLMELPEEQRPKLIIMDDAFQHRRVVPSLSVLLVDYSSPPNEDNLIPFGRLRDLPSQMIRADIVIVTKCPPELTEEEQFNWSRKLNLSGRQKLLFSTLDYLEPCSVFESGDRRYIYSNFCIPLTAIANPKAYEYRLSESYKIVSRLHFRDHHIFSRSDVKRINRVAESNQKAVFFTTEKDAQRLHNLDNLSDDFQKRIFYLPVEVSVLNNRRIELDEIIIQTLSSKS